MSPAQRLPTEKPLTSPRTSPNAAQRSSAHFVASRNRQLLEATVRISRLWVLQLSVHQDERRAARNLLLLAEALIRNEDVSSAGLCNVRHQLCSNCLRLDASQGQCIGTTLEQCRLLNNPGF